MNPYLIIVITGLLTLAYVLIGLRAMLHVDAALGARYLPRTNLGTYLAIVFWPAFWIIAAARHRFGANRRVLS